MSSLAPTLTSWASPYARLDAAWKRLLETGPKWFMDHVWRTCLYYVRASNAWPAPTNDPTFRREPNE